MVATLFLCANHNSKNRAGQKLLRALVERLPQKFSACHIGCFHDDTPAWSQVTVEYLTSLGGRCFAPRLSDPKLDCGAAGEQIAQADLLYLDGGDTVAGVECIRQRGLERAFTEAAQNARFIFGLSGGACAAGPYTIGYDEKDQPYVAPCLDLGSPLPIDVHDEQEGWPELRALLKLRPPQAAGLVIPSHGVLRVGSHGAELASIGLPAVERRKLLANGRWHVESISAGTL